MQFQDSRNIHYVMSAFDKGGRRSNRIRYDKLEKALLGFLLKVLWSDIAEESKSDEHKAAMAGLEVVKRELDIVSQRLETLNKKLDEQSDSASIDVYMKRIIKDEALRATFIEQRDTCKPA